MWSLCRNHYTSNRYQGGLQLDLIKIFLKLKAIFVKENLRFKTLIYISFSYIKSLSDFYHYGESWRRSGNTTLEPCHVRSWNGRQCSRSITRTSQSITTEPSHRFTGAYQSLFLRLFWLGIDHPWTRPKPPINAFKWSPQGITPIYSRSAFYDYSCRCLLCSDTPVTDLTNFALASLNPTHKTDGN